MRIGRKMSCQMRIPQYRRVVISILSFQPLTTHFCRISCSTHRGQSGPVVFLSAWVINIFTRNFRVMLRGHSLPIWGYKWFQSVPDFRWLRKWFQWHIYISTNTQLYQNTTLRIQLSGYNSTIIHLYHVITLSKYSSPRTSLPYYNSTRLQLY